ncbi:MAG: tRNA (adenosine(37)-N6)-threonylcarbamoyltransferase complex ATPase subunit type 1 TsaE [bacterium]
MRGIPGAGKTTFTQELIRHHFKDDSLTIVSPTYTYYQKYGNNLYHFDLYRAGTLTDIMRIGADEILEDPHTICIIEWPDIIENTVHPTKIVNISVKGEEHYFEILDVKT